MRSGLLRVPQTGGTPVPLGAAGDSPQDRVLAPTFLADGNHFVYLLTTPGTAGARVYLSSLDGKRKTLLVSDVNGLRGGVGYVPPLASEKQGRLLYVRDNILLAQALDTRTFTLSGEAIPVVENVTEVSASATGALAYDGAGGNIAGRQPRWMERSGKPGVELGPSGEIADVALSPDGKRAAISLRPEGRSFDVWLVDVERGASSRFTFAPVEARFMVWSPDGKRLAYASGAGRAHDSILMQDTNGAGKPVTAVKGNADLIPFDWSPDGRSLLYREIDPKTKDDLWVLPLGQGRPVPYLQTPFSESDGKFSPDGRWVAYVSDESGRRDVFVQSFPAGNGKFQISTGGGLQPRWRRDGRELYYFAADGKLMAVEVTTFPRFEAAIPKALFPIDASPAAASARSWDVTPDGSRFIVAARKPGGQSSANAFTVLLNWQAALKK